MGRIVLILIVFLFPIGCTSRIVYEKQTAFVPSADAVNINIATIEELDKLPHVGRKTAEAIVQFRTENGPFNRPEHLMQIRGFSEKRFLEIRNLIRTE